MRSSTSEANAPFCASSIQPTSFKSLFVLRGFSNESVVDQFSGLVSSEPRLLDVEGDNQRLPAVEFYERE